MILGLIGGHFLAVIISLFANSLLGRFENEYINFVMYIICLGFGLFFSYHEGWIAGASDKVYISNNQIKYSKFKGFKVGAIASVPNFIIAALGFLTSISALGNWKIMGQAGFEIIYRIWFWAFCWLFPVLEKFAVIHFLPVIAMPIACGVGYILGVKHFHLAERIVYKKDNK